MLFLMTLVVFFPGQGAPAVRIRLSQSNVGLTAASLWVATSHGFFSKLVLSWNLSMCETAPSN